MEPSAMPLSVWWDKWVKAYKVGQVSKASLDSYRYTRRRLPQTLLDMPISKITLADIQTALNGLVASRRTIEITRTALRMCLGRAKDEYLIRRNPALKATIPAPTGIRKAKAMSVEDEAEFVSLLTKPALNHSFVDMGNQTVRDALLLILRTGMRRSECVRLTWGDIKGYTVHVRGTKTAGSSRMIPVTSEDARAMLDRRRSLNTVFVFATHSGKPVSGSNLLRYMRNNQIGYTVHDLRHTYATRARQAGVDVEVLQKLLGHTQVSTTLDIYTHVSEDDIIKAAAKISSICK